LKIQIQETFSFWQQEHPHWDFAKDRILRSDLSTILSCFLMVASDTLALHNSMATLLSSLEKGLVECLFIARMLIVNCPM
jgi:hypothetical protein